MGDGVDRVLFMLESPFYSHRAFSALVLSGVLERHPNSTSYSPNRAPPGWATSC